MPVPRSPKSSPPGLLTRKRTPAASLILRQVKPVYRCQSCGMQFTGSVPPVCPACLIRTVRIDDMSARTLSTPLLSGEDARTDAMMRSNRGTVGRE